MVTVVCTDFNVSHETSELGICRFNITFEESLTGIFPSTIGTTISTITSLITSLTSGLNSNVSNKFTMNYPTNIQDSANKCLSLNSSLKSNIVSATNIDSESLNTFTTSSNSFDENVYYYVQTPSALGEAITSLIFDYNEIAPTFAQAYALNVESFGFGSDDRYIDYNTIVGDEEINNAKTINSTVNAMMLMMMYKNASTIAYDNDQQLNYIVDDLESRYQYFLSNNNLEITLLRSIEKLRTLVKQYLNQVRVSVSKVISVDVTQAPLTVLLYRYYENFGNQQEIVNLNQLKDVSVIEGNIKMVTVN
jgi:hypothetical protein